MRKQTKETCVKIVQTGRFPDLFGLLDRRRRVFQVQKAQEEKEEETDAEGRRSSWDGRLRRRGGHRVPEQRWQGVQHSHRDRGLRVHLQSSQQDKKAQTQHGPFRPTSHSGTVTVISSLEQRLLVLSTL